MTTPPWQNQLIEIKSREGVVAKVFIPLMKCRWALFAKSQSMALKKLSVLPTNTVQTILEHLYGNTPVSRTNLPAFKTCKIIEMLPFDSTYEKDMLTLLHDTNTCDFELIAENGEMTLPIHKYMLATRSQYFRNLFREDPEIRSIKMDKMNGDALIMWAEYIYTGDFNFTSAVGLVELIGSGSTYEFRDPAEIDYLAISSLRQILTSENAAAVRDRATELCYPDIVSLSAEIALETILE